MTRKECNGYFTKALKVNGGFTVDHSFDSPKKGYMVGFKSLFVLPNVQSLMSETYLMLTLIVQELKTPNKDLFLGGWIDEESGKVYIDISENFINKDEALKVAKERGELAIYSLQFDESIYVD